MRVHRKLLTCATGMFTVAALVMLGSAAPASADSVTQNFEGFTTGSPNGQQGWQFSGSYDASIVDPTTFGVSGMGNRAFRISNAMTSGSFSDWVFSQQLKDFAGETGSDGGGYTDPSGTRQSHFEASFQITSTQPAEQPGLQASLAPDRGDGARMSFLRFNDTPGGIDVTFMDYLDKHPLGTPPSEAPPSQGCTSPDDFVTKTIATGLSRTAIHTVKLTMDFLPGPANDRVEVYIDGTLAGTGTSWEDYFRYCEGNPTRPVDSLIFQARSGAGTAPGTLGKGFLFDNLALNSGPITDPTTAGSWTLQPAQSVTTSTSTSTDTLFQTKVKPPINADGTSNWPKKRGVIPVQFELDSSTKTTTTTTTTTGPVKFESVASDNPGGQPLFGANGTFEDGSQSNDFAFLKFTPTGALPFTDLAQLAANYAIIQNACQGGSLRWQVSVDTNGDSSSDGAVQIYYGAPTSFVDCTTVPQTGTNMIGQSDVRYDTGQVGGTFYDTYASALTLVGGANVLRASLVVDSGWVGCPDGGPGVGQIPGPGCQDQKVKLNGATANGTQYTPLTEGSTSTSSSTSTPFAQTCTLPQAKIEIVKNDADPSGPVNETPDSVQNKDTGVFFRNVDCKYIYNLDVSTLGPESTRQGTYRVYANIGGRIKIDPAVFDLK